MDDESAKGIPPEDLETGRRYQVDYKYERLRRSFRFTGTFTGREDREEDGETISMLVFEVRPRFGKPSMQPVNPATLLSIAEA
jgi:hypothetical protein